MAEADKVKIFKLGEKLGSGEEVTSAKIAEVYLHALDKDRKYIQIPPQKELETGIKQSAEKGKFNWFLITDAKGSIAGAFALVRGGKKALIWYAFVLPEHRGKEIIFAAVAKAIKAEKADLRKVVAFIHGKNAPSINAAKKAGMKMDLMETPKVMFPSTSEILKCPSGERLKFIKHRLQCRAYSKRISHRK